MKVLLRNTETGLFYAGPDRWSEEQSGAMEFEAPNMALDTVSEANLEGMEIVVHFEDSVFDIPLRIVGLGK